MDMNVVLASITINWTSFFAGLPIYSGWLIGYTALFLGLALFFYWAYCDEYPKTKMVTKTYWKIVGAVHIVCIVIASLFFYMNWSYEYRHSNNYTKTYIKVDR